jgi:hypothetical protein
MSRPEKKKSKVTVTVTEDEMKHLGGEMMGRDPEGRSESVFIRRWLSFFGVEPIICAETWNLLNIAVNDPDDPDLTNARPEHLLWGLLFLKKYGSEEEMARIAGGESAVDEKTFRKWSNIFVTRIAGLIFDVVRFCSWFEVVASVHISNPDMLFCSFCTFIRSVGRIGKKEIKGMIV